MKEKSVLLRNIAIFLFTAVLLASCEKDKDEPRDKLIGTWTVEDSDFEANVGGQPLLQYFTDQGYTQADAQLLVNLFNVTMQQNFTGTITFNADNTYSTTFGGQNDSGTWSLNDDNDEITIDPENEETFVLKIESLTDDELRVSGTDTGSEDLNDDQIPEMITVTIDMTLTK